MTERGARAVIRRLEAAGWLSVETGGGRAGRSNYQINSERASGFCAINPERGSAPTGTPCTETRNETTENSERNDPKPGTTFRRTQKNKEEQGRGGTHQSRANAATVEVLQADAADGEILDEAADLAEMLWQWWPKKSRKPKVEAVIRAALERGVSGETIARGAAAYVADRKLDDRGPRAVVHYTTPLERWIEEEQWLSSIDLPEAERRAFEAEKADREITARAAEELTSRRTAKIF
uniref:Helix-turn-helix domain-containing protein n=2 Tax=Cereibacter TaxID=1653176 RepID=A4WNQ7_CERS5